MLRASRVAGVEALTKARNLLLIGSAIAAVAAVVSFNALDSDGGVIWTGGFIVAALFYWNAFKALREAQSAWSASFTGRLAPRRHRGAHRSSPRRLLRSVLADRGDQFFQRE
jgi:hypothetical protein